MADQWYYSEDGVRVGPCTTSELRQRAASGRILPTDMIWKEGIVEGALAKNVKNLLPAIPADALPPVPVEAPPPNPVETISEPAPGAPTSDSPSTEDALFRPEEAAPRPGRRLSQPEHTKKGTATAGKGAVIIGQDGTRVSYKRKCTVCGHEDPSRHTMLIRQGWIRTSYYCPKCRKPRPIELLGVMR